MRLVIIKKVEEFVEKISVLFSKMNFFLVGWEEDDVVFVLFLILVFKCVCGMLLCICEVFVFILVFVLEVFLIFCVSYNNVFVIKYEGIFGFGFCYILERNLICLGMF